VNFGHLIAARCASKPKRSNYTYADAAGENLFASASILSASRPIDVRLVRVRCWGKINPKQNYIGVLIS
jgi:coenzyme F420-reducing hydrogenase delta subunit